MSSYLIPARRIVLATAIAALSLVPLQGLANAATSPGPVTGTYSSVGDGLIGVLPMPDGSRLPAWSFIFKVEGKDTETYCVQMGVDLVKTGTYTGTSWASSGVKNLSKASYIATNHATIGTPYTDVRFEKAATQVAIWNLTDGYDYTKIGNAAFIARIKAILDGAKDSAEPAHTLTLKTDGTVSGSGTSAINTVGALVTDGSTPVAGATVTFTVGSSTKTESTDKDGKATATFPATTTAQQASVGVTYSVPSGVVLVPATKGQKVITAQGVTLNRVEIATLEAASASPTPTATPTVTPTPTATPTKTPSVTATPKPTKTATSLPHTGSDVSPVMILLLLLVAGSMVGVFLYTRKASPRH